jgi:hypothetical protein
MISNLALFCLATFQKIGQFFPNHLVTLPATHKYRTMFEAADSEKHKLLRFKINYVGKGFYSAGFKPVILFYG